MINPVIRATSLDGDEVTSQIMTFMANKYVAPKIESLLQRSSRKLALNLMYGADFTYDGQFFFRKRVK